MATVQTAPRGSRPPIRIRRAPRTDPPFDDELDPEAWAIPNQLAFDWPAPLGASSPASEATAVEPSAAADAIPGSTAGKVAHSAGGTASGSTGGAASGSAAGAASGLGGGVALAGLASSTGYDPVAGAPGDARLAVRRFVTMFVEVLNGYRPAAHLRRLSLPLVAAKVVAQGVVGARHAAALRRGRQGADQRGRRPGPVGVLKLRLCEPRPGAVEATVVLVTGERTWAVALRLEVHQEVWCVTVVRLI